MPPPLPRLVAENDPPEVIGMGALYKLIDSGIPRRKVLEIVSQQANLHPDHAGIQIDLATLLFMAGDPLQADAVAVRAGALARQRVYRVAGETGAPSAPRLRLLAFVSGEAPRSFPPIDFILNGSGVRLDLLYVLPGEPLPETVPDHDVAMVAVGESEPNQETLRQLVSLVASWPRPVVNDPARIAVLSRDRVGRLLAGAEGLGLGSGLVIPHTARLTREEAMRLALGIARLEDFLPEERFPLLVRPVTSHFGRDLQKIDTLAQLSPYLDSCDARAFFLCPFVDYRSPDGLHRKYRIAFIRGRPFLCHLALSTDWMIHYANAGMAESAEKRAEEERAMRDFDGGFALRHAAAFETLHSRIGLDYFGIDCGETADGQLLLFEVETAMAIHAHDPVETFPYKPAAMQRIFAAFIEMLAAAARGEKGF